jgi:hypothetical protein
MQTQQALYDFGGFLAGQNAPRQREKRRPFPLQWQWNGYAQRIDVLRVGMPVRNNVRQIRPIVELQRIPRILGFLKRTTDFAKFTRQRSWGVAAMYKNACQPFQTFL